MAIIHNSITNPSIVITGKLHGKVYTSTAIRGEE